MCFFRAVLNEKGDPRLPLSFHEYSPCWLSTTPKNSSIFSSSNDLPPCNELRPSPSTAPSASFELKFQHPGHGSAKLLAHNGGINCPVAVPKSGTFNIRLPPFLNLREVIAVACIDEAAILEGRGGKDGLANVLLRFVINRRSCKRSTISTRTRRKLCQGMDRGPGLSPHRCNLLRLASRDFVSTMLRDSPRAPLGLQIPRKRRSAVLFSSS